jgi:uncharacterized protein (UPF0210 family)
MRGSDHLGRLPKSSLPFVYDTFLPSLPGIPNPDKIFIMKIRSITCFIDLHHPVDDQQLKVAEEFMQIARPTFIEAGYEVQSARLASGPFTSLLREYTSAELINLAQQLESEAAKRGYDYISLGPACPEQLRSYLLVPEALSVTQSTFFSGLMTTSDGKISLPAVHRCADIIQRASTISANGFANLRFAALAKVLPGSPFFPAAYHAGPEPAFALATEAADLAVIAFKQASSLDEARQNLVDSIQENGRKLTAISKLVEKRSHVRFGGIDFSLAPFPSPELSLGTAMQNLGVPVLGNHGSLAAAAILADTIDQAMFPRVGFSGLMFPVLEDAVLAEHVAENTLSLSDLLLYSAVCGTGLDTIPLPGDTSPDQLTAVLLDLATLAVRLNKPLTARLMPIPGKKAGDSTGFDFAFFANSRVMPLRAVSLDRFLATNATISLQPRPHRQN